MLRKKTSVQSTLGKSSSQPVATSTPWNASHQDQLWLQQVDIDAADAFLNQLDEIPAKGSDNHSQPMDKSSKPSNKWKPVQPWFMLLKQKHQHLDMLEVSSDQSSDEPLGESLVTSSSDSDSPAKKSRWHKRQKKCNSSLECLQSMHPLLKTTIVAS